MGAILSAQRKDAYEGRSPVKLRGYENNAQKESLIYELGTGVPSFDRAHGVPEQFPPGCQDDAGNHGRII